MRAYAPMHKHSSDPPSQETNARGDVSIGAVSGHYQCRTTGEKPMGIGDDVLQEKARDHQVVTRFFLHPSEFNPARARLSPRSCSGHDSTWI